jgi:hypothetical protein
MLGRPPVRKYPVVCDSCESVLATRYEYHYHFQKVTWCPSSKGFMADHKKSKLEHSISYSLVKFEALAGITSSDRKMLECINEAISKIGRNAVKRGLDVNVSVEQNIGVHLEDFEVSDLNHLKNYLGERQIVFAQKQEEAKDKIDEMLVDCCLISGLSLCASLLGTPVGNIPMEKGVINHIRQRTLDELEKGERFAEALVASVKQSKVFRIAEAEMPHLVFVETLLTDYINETKQECKTFIRNEGVLTSQNFERGDDESSITDGMV